MEGKEGAPFKSGFYEGSFKRTLFEGFGCSCLQFRSLWGLGALLPFRGEFR